METLSTTEEEVREAATMLSHTRQRPCLLMVSNEICVGPLCGALNGHHGNELDVILVSCGGDPCATYTAVRELRRRFGHLTVYVPLLAKSAATLLCLAADELVLGDFGELGPLDAQRDQKRNGDSPRRRSCLECARVLEQLSKSAVATFKDILRAVQQESGMRTLDAGGIAAEFTGKLYAPLYARIDPDTFAEDVEGEALVMHYAERLLRRYRPTLLSSGGEEALKRLVRAYPSHCFVIDREELQELGLPHRLPDEEESVVLDRVARALIGRSSAPDDIIEFIEPEQACSALKTAGTEPLEGHPISPGRNDGANISASSPVQRGRS
jgi:hypothetical protein